MKTFKTETANVKYSLEELKFQDLNVKDSKTEVVKSKSELFRKMYDAGMEICEIVAESGSHYSFVYGVISNSRQLRTVTKTSASDEIRKMADEGKTPGDIAKALNKNYSFVFGVVKKHNASKTKVETPAQEEKAN